MSEALTESRNLLVRRWGEMGGYWGISRTMAEIHALLFVSTQPLCTDDIMEQLHVSRGNASMNLRGLVDWGLVRRVHKLGDRKEYFQADTNVWSMFETITRERRRREVEPIIATIDRCRELVDHAPDDAESPEHAAHLQRLDELRSFLTTMGALFDLVLRFGHEGVSQIAEFVQSSGLAAPAARTVQSAPEAGSSRPAPKKPRKKPTRKKRA
jgi:DNA-binding transcriptional regulator GbsR (MarR family)